MAITLRSQELEFLLKRVYKKKATGFVSITVQENGRSTYGTLELLKGQLHAARFESDTGRSAVERMAALETPEVSFAASQVSDDKDADIPSMTEVLNINSPAAAPKSTRNKGFSVRTKMLLLFSVLPMLILVGLGVFYVSQLRNMSNTLTDESEAIVTAMAEERVQLAASNVAAEVGRYLADNPGLTKDQFQANPEFLQIALQRVGTTGYTTLLEEASGTGDTNNLFFWVHPDPRIIGAPLAALEPQFGAVFPGLAAVLTQAAQAPGNQTNGYYDWPDSDGVVRAKHLASARVEGTPYYIASTTYISEFTEPMVALKESSDAILNQSQRFVIIAVASAILFTLLSVALYGDRLSKKIQALSGIAESISMGKLGVKIEGTDQNDEIGVLARSIERLRVSVQVMFSELDGRQS